MVIWRRRLLETRNPHDSNISVPPSDPNLPDISSLLLAGGPGSILFYGAANAPLTDTWTITIPVAPFSADDDLDPTTFRAGADGPLLIETSYQLDFIDLAPARSLTDLQGRSFDFPINPSPGYIDGSIYVCHAHNPADVNRIVFSDVIGDAIQARLFLHVNFDYESAGAQDFDAAIELLLREEKYVPRP